MPGPGASESRETRSRVTRVGLTGGLVLAAIATAWTGYAARPAIAATVAPTFAPAAVARGANLAAIGNCIGCHTPADAPPFSGGLGLETGFGTVYSSNLTPSPSGLAGWSLSAFTRAMRAGVARDGRHLYPAFPYDHFTHVDDADLGDLYAYLMTRTPVAARPPPNRMHFPFGWRPLLAGWNLLFLDARPAVPHDPAHDAEWNRGAYLVEGLAHCGACHTPRNALGAEQRKAAYAGNLIDGWYAPPLDPSSPSPLPWTVPQLTEYLRTGLTAHHAIAGGPMQGVTTALAQADEADVRAIATYVASLAGPATAERQQRATAMQARSERPLAATTVPTDPQLALGATVYAGACASCHDRGRDAGSGGALPLPLAVALHDADPRSLLRIVREGITPPDGARGRIMPAFGSALDAAQLTALAAYLRQAAAAPAWPDLAHAVDETRPTAAAKQPS